MIWAYFLIGLNADWLSNSKHPPFYLKIQLEETLCFWNCFADRLLMEDCIFFFFERNVCVGGLWGWELGAGRVKDSSRGHGPTLCSCHCHYDLKRDQRSPRVSSQHLFFFFGLIVEGANRWLLRLPTVSLTALGEVVQLPSQTTQLQHQTSQQ